MIMANKMYRLIQKCTKKKALELHLFASNSFFFESDKLISIWLFTQQFKAATSFSEVWYDCIEYCQQEIND